MKHRAKTLIFALAMLVVLAGAVPPIQAQEGSAGTTSLMNIGASARALGLGRAYVALADDPAAVFWNPAGLEFVPRLTISLLHAPLYEGAVYDFLGFVYPTLQFGTVGVGYARIGVGDIPVVNQFNVQEGVSRFEYSELYISYAKKLPFNLTTGITFKIDRQEFTFLNLVTSGIGLDLGLMYKPRWDNRFLRDLSIGFHYQNLLKPELKLGVEREVLPAQFRLGILKAFPVGLSGRVNVLLDFSKSEFEPMRVHMGTEYNFRDLGTIRVGFDRNNLAFGAGVRYSFVQIDYSFGNLSYQGDWPPTHRFSITFNLGKTREELIRLAEEERRRREKELVERTKEEERQRFIAEHLAKGKELFEQQKYFDAATEFQMVISEDPFNKTAKIMLDSANTLIQRELQARQEQLIAQAVDKELAKENKRFVELQFEKGQLYLQQKRFNEALIAFNLALERSPDDPIILQAIQTTKRRLNQEVRRLVTQARREFQNRNLSEALRILSEALVLSPDDPQLKREVDALANRVKVQQYVQQALQLYDQGRYQEALALFQEALNLDPANEVLRQYMERARRGLGEGEEELDPQAEKQYIVGTELFLTGRYQEALEVWRELARKYPYNQKIQEAIKKAEDLLKRTKEN
ncbi:MAG: PorV/PorQ family protein [Calditrichaeota bacterium]|nr:PorV/PorQ family protein [Calditrichota bacterium]